MDILFGYSTDELCVLLAHSPYRHPHWGGARRELSAKIKPLSIAMLDKSLRHRHRQTPTYRPTRQFTIDVKSTSFPRAHLSPYSSTRVAFEDKLHQVIPAVFASRRPGQRRKKQHVASIIKLTGCNDLSKPNQNDHTPVDAVQKT
jgi:hypothetical protein